MKILLLGHNGYLGSYLYSNLPNVYTDYDTSVRYSYIINCIGKPNLEFCEKNPMVSEESNLNVVKKICDDFPESKLISFSSYYVYDNDGLCDESSNTTDAYQYTKHKLESEKVVIENDGVCFRVGKLFGHPDITKQKKLTYHILKSEEMTIDSVRFNPTSLSQVLSTINFEIHNSCFNGIFNLSNGGVASHYEYACRIRDKMKSSVTIYNVDKMHREFHNYGKFAMDTSLISSHMKLNKWQDDLDNYIREIKHAS